MAPRFIKRVITSILFFQRNKGIERTVRFLPPLMLFAGERGRYSPLYLLEILKYLRFLTFGFLVTSAP